MYSPIAQVQHGSRWDHFTFFHFFIKDFIVILLYGDIAQRTTSWCMASMSSEHFIRGDMCARGVGNNGISVLTI